jgi:hypothetical protein
MSGTLPPGPFEALSVAGESVPSYVIPFDRDGVLQAPLTARHLAGAAADGPTDVYLFSHGWNNDWDAALDLYRRFMQTYGGVVQAHGQPHPSGKSLVVGVFWPSIVLPSSTAPKMAGDSAPETTDTDMFGIQALADEIVCPRRPP